MSQNMIKTKQTQIESKDIYLYDRINAKVFLKQFVHK